jgi:hypothetical protein
MERESEGKTQDTTQAIALCKVKEQWTQDRLLQREIRKELGHPQQNSRKTPTLEGEVWAP